MWSGFPPHASESDARRRGRGQGHQVDSVAKGYGVPESRDTHQAPGCCSRLGLYEWLMGIPADICTHIHTFGSGITTLNHHQAWPATGQNCRSLQSGFLFFLENRGINYISSRRDEILTLFIDWFSFFFLIIFLIK